MNYFLISLQFHFCETFVSYNEAFHVVEYSSILPLRYSTVLIIPSSRVTLLNSR